MSPRLVLMSTFDAVVAPAASAAGASGVFGFAAAAFAGAFAAGLAGVVPACAKASAGSIRARINRARFSMEVSVEGSANDRQTPARRHAAGGFRQRRVRGFAPAA